MSNFPTSVDSPTDPVASDKLNSPSHAGQHTAHNSAIVAIQTWIGALGASLFASRSAKTTPVDADVFGLNDSAASNALKKVTWANIKATLLTWLRLSTTVIPINAPQGFLINGKIVVTDTGSGLKVEIKTLADATPSATDPVYCRIGDTVQTITGALSKTLADGTNWFNAGGSELATKEIDYFVYLGYNATDGVVIGFSRIPYASQYGDFSVTTTNEKYASISTITTAASTDYYEVVGRFAATLSAGAGYTWSVPTYTAINLIQRPIYETRLLDWVPTTTASVGNYTTTSLTYAKYKVSYATVKVDIAVTGTTSGAPQNIRASIPFTSARDSFGTGYTTDAAATASEIIITGAIVYSYLYTFGNYSAGTGRVLRCSGDFEI